MSAGRKPRARNARDDGAEVPDALKHEVALLTPGNYEVRAPELQAECAGDPRHPKAREVIAASREGRLRCPVCGSVVERVFPAGDPGRDDGPEERRRRWHFRRRRGEGECDHEGETVAHRETKTALAKALGETLSSEAGWEVLLEERLENGRRPDVLAVHTSGARAAFEVQYARISRAHWRARRDDYAALGILDYWLLGAETRYGRTRDDLRNALWEEPGQRILYVGRFTEEAGGTGEIQALEEVVSYLDPAAPEELGDLRMRAAPADLGRLTREEWKRLRVYEVPPKPFPLTAISLRLVAAGGSSGPTPRAALLTPLDAYNARREREGLRRLRKREEREAAERARAAAAKAEREKRSLEATARWDRRQEAWLGSPLRDRSAAALGGRIVEGLEVEYLEADVGEGPPLRVSRRTGGWRVVFYRRQLARRSPGAPFSWPGAVAEFFAWLEGRRPLPGVPPASDPAWWDLRRHLVQVGLIVPLGGDLLCIPKPTEEPADEGAIATDHGSPRPGRLPERLRRFLGRFF